MAVWHNTYALNNTTPVALRLHGTDKRRGSTVVIQHSGHGSVYSVYLGGSNINPATDSYGHKLNGGESITISGDFSTADVMYALSSDTTGEVHVMVVGA